MSWKRHWFLTEKDKENAEELKKMLLESFTTNPKGCWEWNGKLNNQGYGSHQGRLVHRFSYSLFKENVRTGRFVCHHCDNPKCFNPDHLYEGDSKTNARDTMARGRNKSCGRSIYKKNGGHVA